MSIFLCSGSCHECSGAEKCPLKSDKAFRQQMLNNHMIDMLEMELLSPEAMIEQIEEEGHSLFNILNGWILAGHVLPKKQIKKFVVMLLPSYLKESMPSEVSLIFQESLNLLVFRIDRMLQDNCKKGECFSCCLLDFCPQKQES